MPSKYTSHFKHIGILLCLTAAVFFTTLFNQFIGDDHVIFEGNTFYTSWKNLPSLFKHEYLTSSTMEKTLLPTNYHSGSVSYRPVLSLTFFLDYFFWQLNPFGYHLTNLILHIANVLLVFAIFIKLLPSPSAAFLGALIFALHPTKAEAVASIGYRADLLACFWGLCSFLAFVRYRQNNKSGLFLITLAGYFLAIFTKESLIILPAVFLGYDFFLNNGKKIRFVDYFCLSLIAVFYLYVYCFVFRNTSWVGVGYLGGDLFGHVSTILWIFAKYLIDLVFPFLVVMIPPLYAPPLEPYILLKLLTGIFSAGFLILIILKFYRSNPLVSFFISWYLVSFIPISNIIPIANPMAHRFLYFPSIAFAALAGMFLFLIEEILKSKEQVKRVGSMFSVLFVGICMIYTIPLNIRWNNDVSVAKTLLEIYPNNIKSHLILGNQYLKAGKIAEAAVEFEECIRLGSDDPTIYFLLGVCFYSQPEKAEGYFKKAIEIYPNVDSPFLALGRLYVVNERYTEAIPYLQKAMDLWPTNASAGFLIEAYLKVGNKQAVQATLEKIKLLNSKNVNIEKLEKLIKIIESTPGPVDLGP